MIPVTLSPTTSSSTTLLRPTTPPEPAAVADLLLRHATGSTGADVGQLRAGVAALRQTSPSFAAQTADVLAARLSPVEAGALAASDDDGGDRLNFLEFISTFFRSFSPDLAAAEGATFAGDLAGVSSLADAPPSVTFTSGTQDLFDHQWSNSLPNGYPDEQGGMLVYDPDTGVVRLTNLEELFTIGGDGASFAPDRYVGDPDETATLGVFHTHPYSEAEGGYTDVSFSGGDFAAMLNEGDAVSVVQSGDRQFMLLRTGDTPPGLDPATVRDEVDGKFAELLEQGHDFAEASRMSAEWGARQYGMAYYEGANGTLNRVA